jgi:glycosyltransferase involved in cell wall biosynthesis
VLIIAIPVRDEAPTIGVLLWRLRTVFQEYPREYEVLVYNDGSTDTTAEVLAPYTKALPLTILGGSKPVGYAMAVDTLLREAARRTKYPRRDAVILMQGDFTDQPEHIPELVRRFEGGADLVVAERTSDTDTPLEERRLRRFASWAVRPNRATPGTLDPFSTFRLIRLAVVRDVIKAAGAGPLTSGDTWDANLRSYYVVAPHARRIESAALSARYDLRQRPSRRRPWHDAWQLFQTRRALGRLTLRAPAPPPVAAPSATATTS